jgi:hypothetical protein
MGTLNLRTELVQRLETLAAQKNQSVEALIETMLDERQPLESKRRNPLEAIVGILDTEETDLSETVRETLAKHIHPEQGWTVKKDADTP